MKAFDLLAIDREQAERIGVPHILLDDERKSHDIVKRFDAVGVEACSIESLFIKGNVFVRMDDGPSQALELQLFELGARHAFDFLLVIHRRFLSLHDHGRRLVAFRFHTLV